MRKGNGKINNFLNWADSRYGNGRDEKSVPLSTSSSQSSTLPQPTITYDIRNNRIYPESQTSPAVYEISQAQLRIAKAREENLALKRIIAQKNIQNNSPLPQYLQNTSTSSIPQNKSSISSIKQNPHSSISPSNIQSSSTQPNLENNKNVEHYEIQPTSNSSLPVPPSNNSTTPPVLQVDPLPETISHVPPQTKKISKNNEKRKLRKEKESAQRILLQQSIADLQRFSEHLDATIDDNKKLLLGDLPLLDTKFNLMDMKITEAEREKKKKMKLEEKQKRQKLKLQMDSLLQGQNLNILPLWRHRLRGTINPKPEEVLKGKSMFRVAYYMVMHFYVKPRLSVQNRKAQTKSSEMDSLLKSLLLFIDNTSHWLGKLIKIPISSIIQVPFLLLIFSNLIG